MNTKEAQHAMIDGEQVRRECLHPESYWYLKGTRFVFHLGVSDGEDGTTTMPDCDGWFIKGSEPKPVRIQVTVDTLVKGKWKRLACDAYDLKQKS